MASRQSCPSVAGSLLSRRRGPAPHSGSQAGVGVRPGSHLFRCVACPVSAESPAEGGSPPIPRLGRVGLALCQAVSWALRPAGAPRLCSLILQGGSEGTERRRSSCKVTESPRGRASTCTWQPGPQRALRARPGLGPPRQGRPQSARHTRRLQARHRCRGCMGGSSVRRGQQAVRLGVESESRFPKAGSLSSVARHSRDGFHGRLQHCCWGSPGRGQPPWGSAAGGPRPRSRRGVGAAV